MNFPALAELEGKISERRKALATIFAEAGPEMDMAKVKSYKGEDVVGAIRALNDEMTELSLKRDGLLEVKRAAEAVQDAQDEGEADEAPERGAKGAEKRVKSFGEMFVDAGMCKREKRGMEVTFNGFDTKTLFQTSAGWAPEALRRPGFVPDAQRPIQVVDVIPRRDTDQTSIVYMEETTFTNNAAEVAENGAYPEAALALTEQTNAVRKLGVWIPVTDEQLEDVAGIGAYLDNRLTFMIRQRLDLQILTGNGTPPNLQGILNVSGIQTQALGTDPVPDAVHKAMTKVRVTGQAFPNLIVMHPNDWQGVRLLRTADGIYIWGSPADSGPERMWGLSVVQAQALTENTGLVGDTSFLELAIKRGMEVKVRDTHGTDFVNGRQAVRADMRAALTLFRPAAFATVTGI